jgi:hypothetical protein
MTARRQAGEVITPLQAFVFAVALAAALIVVLVPVLPGEVSLDSGDVAFKRFESNGTIIAEEGDIVSESDLDLIQDKGMLENHITASGTAAAIVFAILGAAGLALYLYLFQPQEVNTVPRVVMVGLITVLWVAGAKVFLSLTLPDNDRLYLSYMLPIAAAPMLIATLLDGGLAVALACVLAVLATFAGFHLADARDPLAGEPLDGLQMVIAFLFAGLAGTFSVRQARPFRAGPGLDARGLCLRWLWGCRADRGRSDDPRLHVWCEHANPADGAGAAQPPAPPRAAGESAGHLPPQRHRRQPGRARG